MHMNKIMNLYEYSFPPYQTFTDVQNIPTDIYKINLNLDHDTGGKLFIYDPKHHKENQLLRLEHSCWLSIV